MKGPLERVTLAMERIKLEVESLGYAWQDKP